MKLTRADLLAAIDSRQIEFEQRTARWDRDVDQAEHEARLVWIREHREGWREYRDALTKMLRRSDPVITKQEIAAAPKPSAFDFRRGFWTTYRASGQRHIERWQYADHDFGPRPHPSEVADLPGVRALVESILDDEVTPQQLANVGVRPAVVRRIYGIESDGDRQTRLAREFGR